MGYGDELMVTGAAKRLQQTDPRKVRLDYGKQFWSEVFDHNPRLAHSADKQVQMYRPRVNGLRPYCSKKTDARWYWNSFSPPVGELYFQPDELAFAAKFKPDIIIEPNNKARASPNKDWGWSKWIRLVEILRREGLNPVQIGPEGTRLIPGVGFIQTKSFRWGCAVLARARACIVPEGGLHHAAAAVGVPAVVIYGGFISPAQTGYAAQRSIFTGGEPCGSRLPCPHCARAMMDIMPEAVLHDLRRVLAPAAEGCEGEWKGIGDTAMMKDRKES